MKNLFKPILYSAKVRTRDILGLPIKPRMIEFDLTKICNSRCQYCDIWKCNKVGKELSVGEIKHIFSDPILSEVQIVIVTGGEPTTRTDLIDVYKTIHDCIPNATLQLSTNAILKDRVIEVVTECLKYGIVFEVGISIDGVGKDHDEVRRVPGNFESVNYVVDKLNKLKEIYPNMLSVNLGMTVSDLTVDKHVDIECYALKKNLHLEYAWIEQTPFYDNKDKEINVTKNNIALLVNNLPEGPRKEFWLRDVKGKSIRFKCYALKTFFVLRFDGGVAPCLKYYDNIIGNVRQQSIGDILTSYQAKFVKRNVIKPCPGCLNTWAFAESNMAHLNNYIKYYITHPKVFIKELKK